MRSKDIFEANKIISSHNHVIETKVFFTKLKN
jgi:hypothetical protein